MSLHGVTLDALSIEDARSFAPVALYRRLERVVRDARHVFLVPAPGEQGSWARATFLNLTFWHAGAGESVDVLCDRSLPADVVAHIAWHHLAAAALARAAGAGSAPTAAGFFFGESIASAFDLYLLGRLLPNAPDSDFVTTQLPLLGDVAAEAGLDDDAFDALVRSIVADPELAFEDLRALLFEAAVALVACPDARAAHAALERLGAHRFAPLLHHYELSNWILYARAYGATSPAFDAHVQALHDALRAAPVSLEWLEREWLPGSDAPPPR